MENNIPIIKICEVLSVDDANEGDRIKARLYPDDDTAKSIDDIPYAFPLLPKMFYSKPKVGETVLLLTAIANNGQSQRYYIGPIISQLDKIEKDTYNGKSRAFFIGSSTSPDVAPTMEENTDGVYPKNNDISIMGRGKADIQIKPNDVRIRCGVKKKDAKNGKFKFNITDPSYILLKHYDTGIGKSINGVERCNSTATIVADKINLIGNNSKDYFKTKDTEDLISDKEMQEIISKAHQLPYGDILVDFLSKFRTAFLNHTHPFSMNTVILDDDVLAMSTVNLKDMLSDTVRIN